MAVQKDVLSVLYVLSVRTSTIATCQYKYCSSDSYSITGTRHWYTRTYTSTRYEYCTYIGTQYEYVLRCTVLGYS